MEAVTPGPMFEIFIKFWMVFEIFDNKIAKNYYFCRIFIKNSKNIKKDWAFAQSFLFLWSLNKIDC